MERWVVGPAGAQLLPLPALATSLTVFGAPTCLQLQLSRKLLLLSEVLPNHLMEQYELR